MAPTSDEIVTSVLDRYGQSYSEELGLDLSQNTPEALFQWLCASLLLSARISSNLAMRAAAALRVAGWTSAQKLAESTWKERVKVLNAAGYGRFDEKTATMLGDLASKVLHDYGGDLRALREVAGKDSAHERELIIQFKGIGEVGADIFLREMQVAWEEVYPFADRRARDVAERFGLPSDAAALATLVEHSLFPVLVAALIRADLANADPLGSQTEAPGSDA